MLKNITLLLLFLLPIWTSAQIDKVQKNTNRVELLKLAQQFKQRAKADKKFAVFMAKQMGWEIKGKLPNGQEYELMAVREGIPLYYVTDNADAATTTSTTALYSGPFNVDGSGITGGSGGYERLGEWDGGAVRLTHQEFDGVGGILTQVDGASSISNHATHVAGTLVANGTVASARGMAFNGNLSAFDWNSDESEMATAASNGMLISNHSYGFITGWRWNGSAWDWYGDTSISSVEDYTFGFYSSYSRDWDLIANNAPYYLMVKTAGNDRGDGPGTTPPTAEVDGGSDGYDCIGARGVCKNVLTVGAVNAITSGYSSPSDVVMSSFSGWGPTDDGRIKPDIVGNGVGVYSSEGDHDSDYASYNGTSMAAPNVTGSLLLLQEHYENINGTGNFMKAATLKGLAIHTANEAGPADGPDYKHGWGLLDTEAAAQAITDANTGTGPSFIEENTLNDGDTYTLNITSNGQPLRVTISWNDPAGTPVSAALDPTDLMLVNDLDARITHGATTHSPYILDPSNPNNAATTGDNFRDNIEQIYISSTTNGDTYTLTINHKGSLSGGSQDFSLIISGASAINLPSNDLATLSLIAPTNGRQFTSSTLSNAENITMKIKNVGGNDVSGFTLNYRINGGSTITENYVGTLTSGTEEDYTFSTTADLSSAGTYSIEAWVDLPADVINANDNISNNIKHLANPVITTLPFSEDFETLSNQTYTTDQFGLDGLDRADFDADDGGYSRLRTEAGSGFANSGSKALTLDASLNNNNATNIVDLTFNLSNYTSSTNLVFDIQCMMHDDEGSGTLDRIYIRGSDTDSWIEVYNWQSNATDGIYVLFTGIDISGNLSTNSQSPSSSFQIRLQQFDNYPASSITGLDGVTFDDIRIYESAGDVEVLSITAPSSGCGLGTETVSAEVKNNSSFALTNIPIKYEVNGVGTVTETISSIAAGATITYNFTATYDFSTAGTYSLEVWTDLSGDSNPSNNNQTENITSSPLVTSYPYTESFESSNGDWETNGTYATLWEWGTPTNTNISSASDGSKAWVTNLTGDYITNQVEYLVSPCFDLSSFGSDPRVEFDIYYDTENNYDGAWLEYSEDGSTWNVIGSASDPNWYNGSHVNAPYEDWWDDNSGAWVTVENTIPVSSMTNKDNVKFRIVFNSDVSTVREGVGIDLFKIYGSGPEIAFVATSDSQDEDNTNANTSCQNYRDYTVEMNIATAPTGDAIITPSLAGTATQGLDYEISPNTITFTNGVSSNQSFTLRIFDDAEVESAEDIVISYAISGTTNASAGSSNQTYTFTIVNDDTNPSTSGNIDLFTEDWSSGSFATNSWTTTEITSGQDLEIDTGADENMYFDYEPEYNSSTGYPSGYSGIYLTSPVISGTGISSIKLDYDIEIEDDDSYSGDTYIDVEYKKVSDVSWTLLNTYQNTDGTSGEIPYNEIDTDLSAMDGESFQIRFHYHGNDNYSIFDITLDNIRIHGTGTGTGIANTIVSKSEYLGPNQTINFYSTGGEIMATIENLSSHDYGCTQVEIDRTGTDGTTFYNTDASAKVTDKTFKVTPTNNSATGNYRIKVYYTTSEISGWETATGNNRNDLTLLKSPDAITDGTTTDASYGTSPSLGTMGSDYYIQAEFNTGFSGFGGSISGTGGPLGNGGLPITLLSFEGKRQDRENVVLHWTTATEKNNAGFEIEMSDNAQDFEQVGFVEGAGNSSEINNYELIINNSNSGYYRLKQVDFDGSFEYSNIVFVDGNTQNNLVKIYPNPLTQNQSLRIETDLQEFSIIVFDSRGMKLFEDKGTKENLENSLNQSFKEFAEGIYLLQVVSENNTQTLKLMKK